MAKKIYTARRTSSFMPFDQGNRWVIESPYGDILHAWAGHGEGLSQNEAIRYAKALNAGTMSEADLPK